MRLLRTLLCAILLSLGLVAVAHADDGTIPVRLKVGQSTDLEIVTIQSQCDDLTVVKIEAVEKVIRLTGLKQGKTLCSFSQSPGLRRVYEITVSAATK